MLLRRRCCKERVNLLGDWARWPRVGWPLMRVRPEGQSGGCIPDVLDRVIRDGPLLVR